MRVGTLATFVLLLDLLFLFFALVLVKVVIRLYLRDLCLLLLFELLFDLLLLFAGLVTRGFEESSRLLGSLLAGRWDRSEDSSFSS